MKNLANTLKRNSDGRPILSLKSLKNTAVNTTTQKDYTTLMRVYECGEWKWRGRDKDLPTTKPNKWKLYGKETATGAGIDSLDENVVGRFGYAPLSFYKDDMGWNVISPTEFYAAQEPPITPEIISEVNKYFNERK